MAVSGSGTVVTMSGHTFARDNNGVVVTGAAVALNGNGFTTTSGSAAVSVTNAAAVNSTGGNTSTGGGLSGITVDGSVTGAVTWGTTGIPYVIGNGRIPVVSGATLTIAPGAVVKFRPVTSGSCNPASFLLYRGT